MSQLSSAHRGQPDQSGLWVQADFLRLLASQPDGDAVAYAVANGPCARFQASSCAIFLCDDMRRHLTLVGEHGFVSEALDRYQLVPVDVEVPVARAMRTGEELYLRGSAGDEEFPLTRAFFATEPGSRERDWIHLPLGYLGTGIGTLVVAVPGNLTWEWSERSHLTAVAAAVSLWSRIHQLGLEAAVERAQRRGRGGSIVLTRRQEQVLEGIRQGKANKVIARDLGFSMSTVKAEVQAILALLGAVDRHDAVIRAGAAGIAIAAEPGVSERTGPRRPPRSPQRR
ncbi:MAG: hypothetical protein KGP12_07215 [Actinomycetales bacterium]|nr:hypothetical protein [Actinomycetales bacterium]